MSQDIRLGNRVGPMKRMVFAFFEEAEARASSGCGLTAPKRTVRRAMPIIHPTMARELFRSFRSFRGLGAREEERGNSSTNGPYRNRTTCLARGLAHSCTCCYSGRRVRAELFSPSPVLLVARRWVHVLEPHVCFFFRDSSAWTCEKNAIGTLWSDGDDALLEFIELKCYC